MISYNLSNQLLYNQLANSLREKILDGTLAQGSLLPTTRELMRIYDVSQVTVRRAINDLAKEGMVQCQPGRGVMVQGLQEESSGQIKIVYVPLPKD